MNDPIVDEVRKWRDEYAARFGYDLDAMYQDLKRQERESGLIFVSTANANVNKSSPSEVPAANPVTIIEIPSSVEQSHH